METSIFIPDLTDIALATPDEVRWISTLEMINESKHGRSAGAFSNFEWLTSAASHPSMGLTKLWYDKAGLSYLHCQTLLGVYRACAGEAMCSWPMIHHFSDFFNLSLSHKYVFGKWTLLFQAACLFRSLCEFQLLAQK